MPQTAQGRARAEFLATGKLPSHIGPDESKQPLKQWFPVDEENNITGRAVVSRTSPGPGYALGGTISPNVRDDAKVTPKNWVEFDPETRQPTGRRINQADKPGDNWLLGSPAESQAISPLDDKNKARMALAKIDDDRITNGGLRTPVQAMEAARLFEIAYPRSRIETDEAGRKVTKNVRAEPIPDEQLRAGLLRRQGQAPRAARRADLV